MTKVSSLQVEFLMIILLIPSLIENEEDQQIIIHVAIHDNACCSKRACRCCLVDITDVFACTIKIRVRLQLRPYASSRCDKKLDKVSISLLCKTKTKTKTNF